MAYMPPEILNIKRNDVLDYSSADRWSITLIALDILFGHLARGNPFYPLRGGRRVFCNQKDYEDDDLAYFFSRHTPTLVQKHCSKRILDLFHVIKGILAHIQILLISFYQGLPNLGSRW